MIDFMGTEVKYYCLRAGASPRQFAETAFASVATVMPGAAPAATVSAPSPATASCNRAKPSGAPSPAPPVKATPVATEGSNRLLSSQKELVELCKRRFFFRPAFDIYGGVAGFFTYGPPGCAVKNNIIRQWRQHFVIEENFMEVEDTSIMQHAVLKASGHVERFNDFMVKDVVDEAKFYRADKLLEEVMDEKLNAVDITEAQRQEFTSVRNQADAYSREELADVFQKYAIKSPETGNALSEPYEFNLMFPTPIGPGGYLQGYLRPETAQGIFLNYKFCCEFNSNRLPFGVAQVGKSFRNEIAPRGALTRQREFTQAEIEFFLNPKCKVHPKFKNVKNEQVTLFHSNEQLAAKDPFRMSVGDAVHQGIINNECLGYFIVRTYLFLLSVGVHRDHVRFRQHLPTEMAHYAQECWDAEIYTSYGWLECVGIADRAAFDLNAHAKASRCDLQYRETLETPITKEVLSITKVSGIAVMKAFKKDGKMVKEWIEGLSQEDLCKLESDIEKGSKSVEIDGKSFELTAELVKFQKTMEKQSVISFFPSVIEPSFGIDRILTSVLEHVYYSRPQDEGGDDKQTRGVLAFPGNIAPYKCTILPLDQRIARHERYATSVDSFRRELSSLGLSYTMDESGATIGRRYARNDELGIPFAVTLDFDWLEDGVATLRERDAMSQIKIPLKDVAELVRNLCVGEATWAETLPNYPHKLTSTDEWIK